MAYLASEAVAGGGEAGGGVDGVGSEAGRLLEPFDRRRGLGAGDAILGEGGGYLASGLLNWLSFIAELVSFQYSYHSPCVPGLTKNCISICSNSRMRKMN